MANTLCNNICRMSRIFQPAYIPPADAVEKSKTISKSYKHLLRYGIIKQVNTGMYALLPLGLRVMDKLSILVDTEMAKIGAQKLSLPSLSSSKLWKKTDRLKDDRSELFMLKDRYEQQYILNPTCEETICDLISSVKLLSPKSCPLRLYQISNKWRDEMHPHLGFLRGREFLMKDLYTFDINLENAQHTYNLVCESYNSIFQKLGLDFVKAVGDAGSIGGDLSHEYHYVTNIGEDTVLGCPSCNHFENKRICKDSHCPQCNKELIKHKTAEVGHAFLLGTKYSKPLNACYNHNNTLTPLVMGCYGLGLSRILTVAVEVLSTNEAIRWPKLLAPYSVCIIPPKAESKEESASQYINEITNILNDLNIDAIIDDRTDLTIGRRAVFAGAIGYPYLIIIGKSAMEQTPLFEIVDVYTSKNIKISLESMKDYFKTALSKD